eukprot:CAMPEP_0179276750 /NCGR_PEP_ID=MMETSP0797-20121207/34740_1 /TAXON_ID=47934 /ORGANISM="Dinophysis acuminata, Strain DAEP01" /LENGTH=67 /DNA_ID=CAMNT_0020985319 /DNA_START=52 /DNA_END=251 /DNA_ORIENTATION=+
MAVSPQPIGRFSPIPAEDDHQATEDGESAAISYTTQGKPQAGTGRGASGVARVAAVTVAAVAALGLL